MSFELCLYLINLVLNFGNFLGLMGFLGLFASGCIGLFHFLEGSDYPDERKLKPMKILIWAVLSLFLSCFIPSSKTMYVMAGSHYMKQSEIPNEIYKLIKKHLGDELNDKHEH